MSAKQSVFPVCLALLTAAGCSSEPKAVRLEGVPPLNVNSTGVSTPVEVRIYFLRDSAKFMSQPYEQLWNNAKEALGDDWIREPKAVNVLPQKVGDPPKEVPLDEIPSGAHYLGVLALYDTSTEEKGDRRVVVPVEDADSYVFRFSGYSVCTRR